MRQNNKIFSFSLFFPKNTEEESSSNTDHEVLRLSTKDSESLVAALQNPPQPSEGLLSVFE